MCHALALTLTCSGTSWFIFCLFYSPLARHIINCKDDALLKHLYDDNQRIEPEWYCPILPMVLINGADGIGTGWSTKIPNYDIREVVANLRRMLDGLDPLPMVRLSVLSSGFDSDVIYEVKSLALQSSWTL